MFYKYGEGLEMKLDKDFAASRVPDGARKGFWALFVLMVGFTFFSASMSVGARLGNGLNLPGFLAAVVIGGLILMTYTSLLAYVGSATGLSMDLLARRAFGTLGSYLPSALISFTQIGWFGVGVAMFAYPISELLGVNHWVLIVIGGVLMTSTAYLGINALTVLSYTSVPLIAILGSVSIMRASGDAGGIMRIFSGSEGLTVMTGAGMVVGSFVSGGTATPNFVRFAKTRKIAVITTAIAFFLGNTLMFVFGAVGGAATGMDDIFYVMIAQGLAIPAIVVLGLNIWTTNDSAIYSAALGLSNITKLRKKKMALVSGFIGTVTAIWLYNNFIGWLSFLSATLPPVGTILILDYFLNRKKYAAEDEPGKQVNWFAVAGVLLGAAGANYIAWGIAPVNAMAIAAVCFLCGEKIFKKQGA